MSPSDTRSYLRMCDCAERMHETLPPPPTAYTTGSELNMRLKDAGNTVYHESVLDFVRCSEVRRDRDDKINTDMKYNYDMWCLIRKMEDLQV